MSGFVSQVPEGCGEPGELQSRDAKSVIDLENIMYGEKMRDLSLIGLRKRSERDVLKASVNCVKSCHKGSRAQLF